MHTEVVEKKVEQHFIFHDGKKVEVFKNKNGEFFMKGEDGKPVVLTKDQINEIMTETKIVKEVKNFVVD